MMSSEAVAYVCACGHPRSIHAFDLEGPAFCEASSACSCAAYDGPAPPTWHERAEKAEARVAELEGELRLVMQFISWAEGNGPVSGQNMADELRSMRASIAARLVDTHS